MKSINNKLGHLSVIKVKYGLLRRHVEPFTDIEV